MSTPTTAECLAAIDGGAEIRCGFPVSVATESGRAVPDLAHPGAWTGWETVYPGVTRVWSDRGDQYAVRGLAVTDADRGSVCRAIAAVAGAPRHGAAGDAARLAAGRIAFAIGDAMVRARMMDALDGWAAACGELVSGAPGGPDGCLYECAVPDTTARVLVVECPSTGRRYAHLVSATTSTAREGRHWLMGRGAQSSPPDVET